MVSAIKHDTSRIIAMAIIISPIPDYCMANFMGKHTVTHLVLHLRVRQVVQRLQHQHLKHQHHVVRLPPRVGLAGLVTHLRERLAERLEVDRVFEHPQRVAVRVELGFALGEEV